MPNLLSRTEGSETERQRERERQRESDMFHLTGLRFYTVDRRDELIGIWGRWWNDTDREI